MITIALIQALHDLPNEVVHVPHLQQMTPISLPGIRPVLCYSLGFFRTALELS